MHDAKSVKAFTYVEVVIVVIILGIMAALTLPKIIGASIEQAAFSEAVHHLSAYVTAEKAYFLDHDPNYAADCSLLDVDVVLNGFDAISHLSNKIHQ